MVLQYRTPEEEQQFNTLDIIKTFLKNDYINLSIPEIRILENIENSTTTIVCDLLLNAVSHHLEDTANGYVAVLFATIKSFFIDECKILKSIKFEDFAIQSNFSNSTLKTKIDATAEVNLIISLNEKNLIFREHAPSTIAACTKVILSAFEFLINLEKAKEMLKKLISISDRFDIKEYYINMLCKISQFS